MQAAPMLPPWSTLLQILMTKIIFISLMAQQLFSAYSVLNASIADWFNDLANLFESRFLFDTWLYLYYGNGLAVQVIGLEGETSYQVSKA